MTSPSDPPHSGRAGVTLFEALVVLALLAILTGVALGARRGPSPALELARLVAARSAEAARLRRLAVETGVPTSLEAPDGCDGATTLVFLPDGTARGDDLCISVGDRSARLTLDRLTGRLDREAR